MTYDDMYLVHQPNSGRVEPMFLSTKTQDSTQAPKKTGFHLFLLYKHQL